MLLLLLECAQINFGVLLVALRVVLFLQPNQVLPGGITGLGVRANDVFGWAIAQPIIVLTLPLFLAGF